MKSILFRLMLVLAAFAIVPDSWAADTDGGNVFLDAKIGSAFGKQNGSNYSHQGTHSSWGADGGYLWKLDDQRSAGFELGYLHFDQFYEQSGNSGSDRTSATSAISLGGHFQVLFGDDRATIFQLHGGLMSVKMDDHFTSNFPTSSSGTDSWRQTGLYVGLGIGRKLTQGLSVILAYSYYGAPDNENGLGTDLNLNWLGLVAEYQF